MRKIHAIWRKYYGFHLYFTALIFTLCTLPSCQTSYKNYGTSIIPFKNDSVATLESKKLLNSLNDQDFLYRSFLTKSNQNIPYRLLTPYNNQPSKKYPLIITFHNSSRIGSDNKNQLEPLARIWLEKNIREKFQGYIVAPQFATRPTIYAPDSQKGILTSKAEPQLFAMIDLIDSIKKEYNIDENRIYLVGYSMGGSSVIDLLNFKPDKFAAAVAIAGVPQFDHTDSLKNVPIWLIHGTKDTENPFSGSEQLYQEINQYHKTRYWIFENRTHDNIVSTALLGENIPKWLFTKKR